MNCKNNEEAWTAFFSKYNVLQKLESSSHLIVTAKQINEFREARLMAKFDFSDQRPPIFKNHDLSILPVSRGSYAIGRFAAYASLEYPSSPPVLIRPTECETLDHTNLYSESAALAFAYNSGIIDLIMEEQGALFTICGRMASGEFSFRIANPDAEANECELDVANAQVEIDGGYEGKRSFCIVEAKNVAPTDFLARQLYYPYRLWADKLSKPVIPVFLVYSNDVFTAFRYAFREEKFYNSLELVWARSYAVAPPPITLDDAVAVWKNTKPVPNGEVPFPQADSFPRIVDLLSLVAAGPLSRADLDAKFPLVSRQTDYYLGACRYLGLMEKFTEGGSSAFRLSRFGKKIFKKGLRDKNLGLMAAIFRCPVHWKLFQEYLRTRSLPSPEECERAVTAASHLVPMSGSTPGRRAKTPRGWMKWILSKCLDQQTLVLEKLI